MMTTTNIYLELTMSVNSHNTSMRRHSTPLGPQMTPKPEGKPDSGVRKPEPGNEIRGKSAQL